MMDGQVDASGARCLESRPDPVATWTKEKVGREDTRGILEIIWGEGGEGMRYIPIRLE
jgi:hypothetical protein